MISYDVGQVGVEINHSHMNKLTVLKMTMENWKYNDEGILSDGEQFEADLHKVDELMDKGKNIRIPLKLSQENFLTKEEMLEMNKLFKRYDGKRG